MGSTSEGHARLELGRLAGRPLVRLRTTVRSASNYPSIGFGFGVGRAAMRLRDTVRTVTRQQALANLIKVPRPLGANKSTNNVESVRRPGLRDPGRGAEDRLGDRQDSLALPADERSSLQRRHLGDEGGFLAFSEILDDLQAA